jgi:hypothetical protein
MTNRQRSNLVLGLLMLIGSMALLFIWIPLDVETGIIEKARRRTVIGDAFAPSIAGLFLLMGAIGLLLPERNVPDQPVILKKNLQFIASAIAIIGISLIVMRYLGPLAVGAYNQAHETTLEYRLLRDTFPWKYLGFLVGGMLLISGLIGLVYGRFSWKSLAIGIVAVLLMIAVYDLPFDDLLLPPNGDV